MSPFLFCKTTTLIKERTNITKKTSSCSIASAHPTLPSGAALILNAYLEVYPHDIKIRCAYAEHAEQHHGIPTYPWHSRVSPYSASFTHLFLLPDNPGSRIPLYSIIHNTLLAPDTNLDLFPSSIRPSALDYSAGLDPPSRALPTSTQVQYGYNAPVIPPLIFTRESYFTSYPLKLHGHKSTRTYYSISLTPPPTHSLPPSVTPNTKTPNLPT